MFKAGDTFVSTTVLLESEWVLRSVYNFSPHEITTALRALAGLPGVSVERPSLLAEALDLVDRGLDFADALRLGAATHCYSLLTFDLDFIEAAPQSPVRVSLP